MDIMEQDFHHLREGRAILKPVYQHTDGTFAAPVYVRPQHFTVIEGLLAYHTQALRECFDVRVFLAPPEDLRRQWKVKRDCSRRGYTTDQVLEELDRREPDSETFIRPQRHFADLVVSFQPGNHSNQSQLDALIGLREGLTHPDLSSFVDENGGLRLTEGVHERSC
jgi:phosphoribulokinase